MGTKARSILGLLLLPLLEAAISQSWRPVMPAQLSRSVVHATAASLPSSYRLNLYEDEQSQLIAQDVNRDECPLYKVVMNQQHYFEYIHYKINMPDLKEFTLCMWTKFTNHTNNHPLFSYAVGDQPRSILSWIANTQRSSYYMMNVDGHNLYRLNYPLRLNKWYHSCQSWNGRTGEWQIWVNDERVGRGFNNRLVGHVIKGGGIAISGQEQQELGGGFLEGEGAPTGSGGMLGELTMVQLYGVALTAGKAHRDHKHHHAHHFEHDTNNNMPRTTTSSPVTGPPLPVNPYLTGGQLNHQVKINPGAHIQIIQNGVTLRHPNLPAPAEAPQPLPPAILPTSQSTINILPQAATTYNLADKLIGAFLPTPSGDPPVNGFSFVDRRYRDVPSGSLSTLKGSRNEEIEELQKVAEQMELKKLIKREITLNNTPNTHKVSSVDVKCSKSRKTRSTIEVPVDKKKRGLVLANGSIIDDQSYVPQRSQLLNDAGTSNFFEGLMSFGLVTKFKSPVESKDEREPAENEVRRVMNICNGCTDEPFEKALIMSWRNVPKKLYSGALHVPAVQACEAF